MEFLNKLKSYLYFWRKQPSPNGEKPSFNLRTMHTINKISITMFLAGLIYMIIKFVIL